MTKLSAIENLLPFASPQATILKQAGGKGSSLAQLFQAGFSVPNGFIINSVILTGHNIAKKLNKLSTQIHILAKDLGGDKFAVRSSALAEDGKNYSWAGQFESYLNVSVDDLLEKVIACANSTHSARVKAYRKGSSTQPQIAVIIQEMVPAEISGVAFTTNPITNDSNEIFIEFTAGTGESLVQGEVIPEQVIVDKSSLKTKSSQTELGKTIDPKLFNSLVLEILHLEKFQGFACDVEWAFSQKRIHILQCRPITTLYS